MATAILGLLAETSVHAGASTSNGVIDLPIQREAHTGWPCVFGSGVKGALRTRAWDSDLGWVDEVFGPAATGNPSDHAGALAVSDARLLLLPVRSLTSHFKWVTCRALLRRAMADCRRMGVPLEAAIEGIEPTAEQAIVAQSSTVQNKIFLEELSFDTQQRDLGSLIEYLARFMKTSDASSVLMEQLSIVHDDVFSHLAMFATPVGAHIAIDNTNKTVKRGALWYEETLPPETVLYVCLSAHGSRKDGSTKSPIEVLRHVTHELLEAQPYLQLGGNETVGMGWCQVAVIEGAT